MNIKSANTEINRLRSAFPGAIVSSGRPVNEAPQDVASKFGALKRQEDAPVSITVILAVQ
ncbi:hypothetical protein EUU23_00025 [Sphingorhabdus sp. IMCC26285]|jgi:hypothetical protein|uniref:Uncharacterized protein n=1 Tax=Sphingorhabdus profundilacus TaxID=2509718 RepID=A0A6I4LVK1_9SPHN|nr:hypothetical protein [Sphingorhabdus profundilacus]MVZ96086.1 hypothetical protein [Sphingorhabdus profundilacus]